MIYRNLVLQYVIQSEPTKDPTVTRSYGKLYSIPRKNIPGNDSAISVNEELCEVPLDRIYQRAALLLQ